MHTHALLQGGSMVLFVVIFVTCKNTTLYSVNTAGEVMHFMDTSWKELVLYIKRKGKVMLFAGSASVW